MGIERDVAHEDHVVVAFDFLEDAREDFLRVLAVALEELVIGLDHAARRVEQAFAARVLACPAQEHTHRGFRLLAARAFGRGLLNRPERIK